MAKIDIEELRNIANKVQLQKKHQEEALAASERGERERCEQETAKRCFASLPDILTSAAQKGETTVDIRFGSIGVFVYFVALCRNNSPELNVSTSSHEECPCDECRLETVYVATIDFE